MGLLAAWLVCAAPPGTANAQDPGWRVEHYDRGAIISIPSNRRNALARRRRSEQPPPPLPARRPRHEAFDGRYQVVRSPAAKDDPGVPLKPGSETSTKAPAQPDPQTPSPTDTTLNGWSQNEIDTALAECISIVKRYDAEAMPEPPIKEGACGTPAPVKLMAIGKGKSRVTFDPPVTVNCRVIAAMSNWLSTSLQPLARRHLKSSIATVETMSSYSCRTAYGRVARRLSEHGYANAIDIRGFTTAAGGSVNLLEDWGPTARDVRKRLLAEQAEREKAAKARLKQTATSTQKGPAAPDTPAATSPGKTPQSPRTKQDGTAGVAPAIPESKPPPPVDLGKITAPPPATSAARFLRDAHSTGCDHFGTILGPEVNEAHRNHFHVDLAPRQRSNYCR